MKHDAPILDTPARTAAIAALVVALGGLVVCAGRLIVAGYWAIGSPWELDYGEGIVWEQMRLMLVGQSYGPIDGLPAIVFHYPPLYHMLAASMAGVTGFDGLAAGRLTSLTATLFIGLFAGLIARRAVRDEVSGAVAGICGAFAGLAVFSLWPVALWAPLMRVDMLATALSLAGLFAAMLALNRSRYILLSGALFVAAVYTKQTSIVAPAAVFITFLLLRPKLAWACAATCLCLGLALLGALAWYTDGGFLRHIFLYNVNRFEAWRLLWMKDAIHLHLLLFAAAGIGLWFQIKPRLRSYKGVGSIARLRERLAQAPSDGFLLLVLIYAGLATVMALSVAKSGSNINYFIEWLVAVAILVGIAAKDSVAVLFRPAIGRRSDRLLAQPAVLFLLIGVHAIVNAPSVGYSNQAEASRAAEMERLSDRIRRADRPIISDDMVLLVRNGVPVQWEPAIFAELASTGVWDEAPFVARVRAREFAFFVTAGDRGERLFDSRYNRAVADAMDAAYPLRQEVGGYTIHLPEPMH